MKFADCPRCLTRVVLSEQNTCPSFQQDVNDLTGVDHQKASVTLFDGKPLPANCIWCDQYTDKLVKVIESGSTPGGSTYNEGADAVGLLLWFLPFGRLLRLLTKGESKGGGSVGHRITVKVPLCRICKGQKKKVEVVHSDFREYSIKIITGKEFAARLAAERKPTNPREPKRWNPKKSANDG